MKDVKTALRGLIVILCLGFFLMVVFLGHNSGSSGKADPSWPTAQAEFYKVITESKATYSAANGNEILQDRVRKDRKPKFKKLFASSKSISNWVGTISEIRNDPSGAHVVVLLDQDKTKFHFLDVKNGTPLFEKLAHFHIGDKVKFGGRFKDGDQDFILEASFSNSGSVLEPEFELSNGDISGLEGTASEITKKSAAAAESKPGEGRGIASLTHNPAAKFLKTPGDIKALHNYAVGLGELWKQQDALCAAQADNFRAARESRLSKDELKARLKMFRETLTEAWGVTFLNSGELSVPPEFANVHRRAEKINSLLRASADEQMKFWQDGDANHFTKGADISDEALALFSETKKEANRIIFRTNQGIMNEADRLPSSPLDEKPGLTI